MSNTEANIFLESINVFPIKSLAGMSCNSAMVEKQGLKNDRLYMLVDDQSIFISQRAYPQLALLDASIKDNGLRVISNKGNQIDISKDDFLPCDQSFQVWQDKVVGRLASEEINQYFSDFLNKNVRLIQYDKQQARATDPQYSKPDDIVSFADGFPILLLNQASLDDLNQKLVKPVSMNNFRGNLIIKGADAFAEDDWKKIKIGNIELDLVKPCSRCVMTTNDPKTAIPADDLEPLRTLAKYRKTAKGIMFGVNLIARGFGEVCVGDAIEVIQ